VTVAATIHTKPYPLKLEAVLVWAIIILAMLLVIGPLMWLRPTPRERRLAALRGAGQKAGLRVTLRQLPKLDLAPEDRVTPGGRPLPTTRELAVYLHPLEPKLRMLPGWRILRGSDGLPAWPGWVFESGRKPDNPWLGQLLATLAPHVERLPADVIALECDPFTLGAYWLERPHNGPAEAAALAAWLGDAAAVIGQLEAALAPADE